MTTAAPTRRLPGFRFEVQSPPLDEVLPRMDIAVFVGFASSGPLHRPVPIDDPAQFAALFGPDAPLAWDAARGETVPAYLGAAVRAFFRNGGLRCWIVRVAGEAATANAFPIPGLAQVVDGVITPAYAQARSKGSWSDPLRTSATLLSRPLEVTGINWAALELDLAVNAAGDVGVGDLLRLSFNDHLILLLEVRALVAGAVPPPAAGRVALRVQGGTALWFRADTPQSMPPMPTAASTFTATGAAVALPLGDAPIIVTAEAGDAGESETLAFDLAIPLAEAPPPGTLLRVDAGAEQLWLMVGDLSAGDEGGSPPIETVRVSGRGLWAISTPPPPPDLPLGEVLSFELWVRQGDDYPQRLSDLAFAPGHARYCGALPTDEQLYEDADPLRRTAHPSVWQDSLTGFFPLAGNNGPVYFPLAMALTPDLYLGAAAQAASALERDGLAVFDAPLFLDPDLIETGTQSLLAEADFIRYEHPQPRSLRGLHRAFDIEEATLIAVPDAIQRGWPPPQTVTTAPPQPSPPLPHPEWWRFLDCAPERVIPLAPEPAWGNFIDCGLRLIAPPALFLSDGPDAAGTFTLNWTTEPETQVVVEEALLPNFADAFIVYTGANTSLTLYGRSAGNYYYRARATDGAVTSDWSNGLVVEVTVTSRWTLLPEDDYSADTLLAVQRAVLRLCGARGDLFAVLALPEHYREDDAINHAAALKSPTAPPISVGAALLPPLGFGETRNFSFGALYHPWLIGGAEENPGLLQRTPPDGAATGLLAQRALTRGAWIAPANERLTGLVALSPAISRERWLDLQTAQVNVVRQEPAGFVILSDDTLSDDADLRPINVRRLLMLLRRLALKRATQYVFEPNSDAFRRLVQRGFEALLGLLFERGAFAGRTKAEGFQVVTDNSLNTPQSVDQGRFIVQLRVAPALPMRFMTIRLVQTNERATVTER